MSSTCSEKLFISDDPGVGFRRRKLLRRQECFAGVVQDHFPGTGFVVNQPIKAIVFPNR
jgi:hypothetical protein